MASSQDIQSQIDKQQQKLASLQQQITNEQQILANLQQQLSLATEQEAKEQQPGGGGLFGF